MTDEGTLRSRLPEIPWDQPVFVNVPVDFRSGERKGEVRGYMARWCCRYCVLGLQRQTMGPIFLTREQALDHIEREHHD